MSDADTIASDARRERHEERMIRDGADFCATCGALTMDHHRSEWHHIVTPIAVCEDCRCDVCETGALRHRRRDRYASLRRAAGLPADGMPRGLRGRTA